MAHDGSLASLTEQWICDQVAALAPFTDRTVEPFRGSESPDGETILAELTRNRSPYGCCLFTRAQPVKLEEGQQEYLAFYDVIIAVVNAREGSARKGDGTTPGTNLIRDLMINALHDKYPALSANGRYAQRSMVGDVALVFQRRDAFLLRVEVVVQEVAAAV